MTTSEDEFDPYEIEEFASPFFLLIGTEPCWKCKARNRVAGIAAGNGEPFVLTAIAAMPPEILAAIRQIQPRYELRPSRTSGLTSYMNSCPCGAVYGDFYLFSEPGGAFFPTTPEAARAIEIHELPLSGTYRFECSPAMGTGGFILQHGTRIAAGTATRTD